MKDGFVRVASASPTLHVADCAYNCDRIEETIDRAASLGVALLVLPELCITGYTCGDLFQQSALLNAAKLGLERLAAATAGKDMLVFVGVPLEHDQRIYNCAAALYDGRVLGIVPKTNLPNYGASYELRTFDAAPLMNGIVRIGDDDVPFGARLLFDFPKIPGLCVGAELCEDLWVAASPSIGLTAAGATVICNLSACAETVGKADYRRTLCTGQSAKLVCGYVYADASEGESTGDAVYCGHDLICENGALVAESKPFGDGFVYTELDVDYLVSERRRMALHRPIPQNYQRIEVAMEPRETVLSRRFDREPFIPSDPASRSERFEEILSIQSHALARRVTHTHSKTLVVGISGGLDSSLALLVAVRAMALLGKPATDVIAITMPCFGTTARTKNNAVSMCEELGVTLRTIPIGDSVTQHFKDIGHDPDNHNVVFENSQARERTQILMDVANGVNGMVVGTGDLSELALGWATYNGDHMSMYGVNASVPKTLMRYLVGYEAERTGNKVLAEVLRDILATPVSPELLPASDGEISQKTEELVGPYLLHDFYLFYIIRRAYSPKKVYRLAKYVFAGEFSDEVLLYWLKNFYRRFFTQQFKRSCLPDGPKVGSVSLSPRGDWRMPSDAFSTAWMSELEDL